MRTIQKLSAYNTSIAYKGYKSALSTWFGFALFVIGGGFVAYNGLRKGDVSTGLIGGGLAVLYMVLMYFILRSSVYVPQKTFLWARRDKEALLKYVRVSFYLGIAILLICGVLVLLNVFEFRNSVRFVGYLIGGLVTTYVLIKSMKVHSDIDYGTNLELSELLNIQIDEKIVASYQNFDSSGANRRKNDNIIVVTNRKLFFAVFNGTNWMVLNKLLVDIVKIGITGKDTNSYLKLVFSDDTTLGLRLDLFDKITTTPQLFIRQFLIALDATLLGYDLASSSSRRRVSVSNSNGNSELADLSGTQSRNIELNSNIINELKSSEEVKPGRILEI
jgi:hypothetical protein